MIGNPAYHSLSDLIKLVRIRKTIMPQLAPVVLKDQADADHAFTPRDIVGGVATLVKSTGVPIADQKLAIRSTRTPTGRIKTNLKFTLPVVQDVVVNGISKPTVVRTSYVETEFLHDGTSNASERLFSMYMILNLLKDPMAAKVIRDLEALY